MSRDQTGGTLMILGALSGAFALALHPTAHDILNPDTGAAQARLGVLVHSVAIAGLPVLFLGFLAMARRLGPSNLTTAALVFWGFGGVAVLSAAVASGFVATDLFRRVVAEPGPTGDLYHLLGSYTGMLNQGYARVNVVAAAVAILLWSAAIIRSGRMSVASGWAGAVVGLTVLAGFFSGHLQLDVHGFGLITFLESGWMIWLGVQLWRRPGDSGIGA